MAANNIFSRAKEYVKAHPRTSFQDAIQKVKGKKTVSGVKRKPVIKATIHKKPAATGNRRGNSTGPSTVHTGTLTISGTKRKRIGSTPVASSTIGAIQQSQKIIKNIDKLERERRALKSKELKDIYSLTINAEHKKLKDIAAKIRQRS